MDVVAYKKFEIKASPHQLVESGEWSLNYTSSITRAVKPWKGTSALLTLLRPVRKLFSIATVLVGKSSMAKLQAAQLLIYSLLILRSTGPARKAVRARLV